MHLKRLGARVWTFRLQDQFLIPSDGHIFLYYSILFHALPPYPLYAPLIFLSCHLCLFVVMSLSGLHWRSSGSSPELFYGTVRWETYGIKVNTCWPNCWWVHWSHGAHWTLGPMGRFQTFRLQGQFVIPCDATDIPLWFLCYSLCAEQTLLEQCHVYSSAQFWNSTHLHNLCASAMPCSRPRGLPESEQHPIHPESEQHPIHPRQLCVFPEPKFTGYRLCRRPLKLDVWMFRGSDASIVNGLYRVASSTIPPCLANVTFFFLQTRRTSWE